MTTSNCLLPTAGNGSNVVSRVEVSSVSALPGVSGIIGGLAGGVIMSRLKLKTTGAVRFMMFSTTVVMCGLAIIMMLSCPQENMAGYQDVVTNT